MASLFLSTLSLRRATNDWARLRDLIDIYIHALLAESDGGYGKMTQEEYNFYPRSPCGERQRAGIRPDADREISIHALLAESDSHTYTRTIAPL